MKKKRLLLYLQCWIQVEIPAFGKHDDLQNSFFIDIPSIRLFWGTIYFDTPNVMKELLENEGLKFNGDQITNFEKHFWDPAKELEMFK